MDLPEPVTRKDALAAGFTDSELSGSGWHRLRRGMYLPTAAYAGNLTALQRHVLQASAAASASSDEAVISHVTAAVAHGLPIWAIPLEPSTCPAVGGRARGRVPRPSSTQRHSRRRRRLGGGFAGDVRRATVVDLARTIPFEQAVVVGDAALQLGKTTVSELADQLERQLDAPGAAGARRVLQFLDGRAESPGESRSRVALSRWGTLPNPECSHLYSMKGRFLARVDFLFPELGVIGEFDGEGKYRREDLRGTRTADDVGAA